MKARAATVSSLCLTALASRRRSAARAPRLARSGGRPARGGGCARHGADRRPTAAGVPLRDPDGVAEQRLLVALGLVAVLIAADAVIRAGGPRARRWRAARALASTARRRRRAARLLRDLLRLPQPQEHRAAAAPGELFDRRLGDFDRSLFGGRRPGRSAPRPARHRRLRRRAVGRLHAVLRVRPGLARARARVRRATSRPGLFFVTALSLNWLMAAGSYFLLPSLGPVYADPADFAGLPSTGVSHLQDGAARAAHRLPPATRRPPARRRASARSRRCTARSSSPRAIAAHLLGAARGVRVAVWAAARADRRWRRSTSAGTTCSTTSAASSSRWPSLALARVADRLRAAHRARRA